MNKTINEDRKYLIQRLGYFRNRAKLSARELSQRLGFSIAYIAKFENGDFNMPCEVLLDAIKICGTTPEEFFSTDIENFAEHKNIIENYKTLNSESKSAILRLLNNMKRTSD